MATKTNTQDASQVLIKQIAKKELHVKVKGKSPLIVHKWSKKAKQQMLDAQQGKKAAKEVRDPKKDFEDSIYYTEQGDYGFPVLAFKAAMVRAAKHHGIPMTDARQLISVEGVPSEDGAFSLAVITTGDEGPSMREDVCRIARGGTDLRYRAEFRTWEACFKITFYPSMIDMGSVLNLLEFAGDSVGVGEWRPERNGDYGRFGVDTDEGLVVTDVAVGQGDWEVK